MLNARGFAGEEILKINRLVSRPDAARTAKVGDTGLGADAGAGEKDYGAIFSHLRSKFFQLHHGCAGSKGDIILWITDSTSDHDTKRIGSSGQSARSSFSDGRRPVQFKAEIFDHPVRVRRFLPRSCQIPVDEDRIRRVEAQRLQ